MTSTLTLTVVSQEKKLLEKQVESVTAMSSQGEITILPFHIPLFTKVVTSVLRYETNGEEDTFVISDGFLTVSPDNEVIVMVDSATHVREISLEKAQQAVEDAKKTMLESKDNHELILAEASLKKAMLEIRVASKSKKQQF